MRFEAQLIAEKLDHLRRITWPVPEVIGVFPDVEADHGESAFHDGGILIGGGDDFEILAALDEPGPAGAEAGGGGGGELFLELVEAAEGFVDRLGELTDGSGSRF